MKQLRNPAWSLVSALALAACAAADKPTVELGRELYSGNGCASCHGPDGHGDGFIARTMDTPPRDLRNVSAFRNGTDAAAIAETLRLGIGDGTEMPAFVHFTAHERMSLALYVISIRDSSRSTP